ncbi:MAG: ATP-binding protein [Methanosphaera stadtmanae]|jgi:Cdc6-like AAA superfamily ATPase|nr:ATP-binding protein [Methanosphaera stadtmanae]
MSDYKLYKKSPFSPGNIVNPENFVGREIIIKNIIRYLPNIFDGENRHFYLVGNRGMGKSSLSDYLSYILEVKYDVVTVKISNEGVEDVNTLIIRIIEALLNNVRVESLKDKLLENFSNYVETVGVMGLKIKLKPQSGDLIDSIRHDFPSFIKELCSDLYEKKAIFIIIDDVNGLSKTPVFTNWYKSFVDNLTMRFDKEVPVAFLLTSYPENLEKLKEHNPSFSRIFYHYDVNALSEDEVIQFYKKCFNKTNIQYDEKSLKLLSKYCYGIPLVMQELGENIFWRCETQQLDIKQIIDGIRLTNNIMCDKYLNGLIKNKTYVSILDKIGKIIKPTVDTFSINKLKENTTDEEKDLIDLFISDAIETGILYREKYALKDECKFSNPLYSVYLKNKNL